MISEEGKEDTGSSKEDANNLINNNYLTDKVYVRFPPLP
mgnify:CR=1 FL=1